MSLGKNKAKTLLTKITAKTFFLFIYFLTNLNFDSHKNLNEDSISVKHVSLNMVLAVFFELYDLAVQQLNRRYLQSAMIGTKNLGIDFDDIDEEKQEEIAAEMLVCDTVVALVVDPIFCESYIIKITEGKKEKKEDVEDSFGHVIKKGMEHLALC